MKTKIIFRLTLILIALIGIGLSSCKKDKTTDSTPDSSSLQQLATDETNMQNATDEALNDVSAFLTGGNLKSTEMSPCHVMIDSTSVFNDTIAYYLTYDGPNCAGTRIRTGQTIVKKQVGTHWIDAGATVIVKFINLHITKVSSGKSITLNGQKTFQNFSGGKIGQLGNGLDSIIYKIWGYVNVTFDNNTSAAWHVARQRVFTGTPGELLVSNTGFGSNAGVDNLVTWGTNRNGEDFYTQIQKVVVTRQTCDWDPVSGIKLHRIPAHDKQALITFGYDSNNQPVTNGDCPTKYRVDWQKNGNSGTVYLWLP